MKTVRTQILETFPRHVINPILMRTLITTLKQALVITIQALDITTGYLDMSTAVSDTTIPSRVSGIKTILKISKLDEGIGEPAICPDMVHKCKFEIVSENENSIGFCKELNK